MNFDPIVDPFPPLRPSVPPPHVGPDATEQEEKDRAAEGETTLTSALVALKRKGKRSVTIVEAALGPTRVVLGASLVIGLGAMLVYGLLRRAPQKRRSPRRALVSALGRSIAGELAVRAALGAAGVIGAHLAETMLVPMLVASLSARAVAQPDRALRDRRKRSRRVAAP